MPTRAKISASLTLIIAVLFCFFFQVSKHDPALSHVNAFAEDPYDAIGSFGVQVALFTALLALLRAFRPYPLNNASDDQKLLFFRTGYLSCLSIAATLIADVVAMIRYPSLWIGSQSGQRLAILLGAMALLTAFVGWFLYHSSRTITVAPRVEGAWTKATLLSITGILLLRFYPAEWRQSVHGELLTVYVGILLLFVPIWALVIAISSPSKSTHFEDSIDDLTSIYRWLKAHAGALASFFLLFEKIPAITFVHTIVSWFNPRKYAWNLSILIGIFMGAVLFLGEVLGEGGGTNQLSRIAFVATVFIVLEGSGVLMGYVLLAKPLGLFRHDAKEF